MLPNNKLKKIKKNNKENVAKDKFREKFLNYLKEKGDYDEYNKIVEEFGDLTDKKPKKINKPDEFIDDEYNIDNINDIYNEVPKKENIIIEKEKSIQPMKIEMEKKEVLTYPFMETLTAKIDEEVIADGALIEHCIYTINNSDIRPFLLFMLYKLPIQVESSNGVIGKKEELFFSNFQYKKSKNSLLEQSKINLTLLLHDNIVYKGYIKEKYIIPATNTTVQSIAERIILFYESKYEENIHGLQFMNKDSNIWWGTVSEIFNYNSILYFKINNTVIKTFSNNPNIMQIFENNKLIETPVICYYGGHSTIISYISIFGLKKSNITSRFGPYYYFTDYKNSMRYACYSYNFSSQELENGTQLTLNEKGKYNKGGVVRFIIFVGAIKVFMKRDKPDESVMSEFMAKKSEFDNKTIQFRDCDGKWTENYDCAYNGEYKIELNNNEKRQLEVRWCIHDYNKQIPLSYQYIDMNSVPDEYDINYKDYKLE